MRRIEPYLLVDIDVAELAGALGDWAWRIGTSWAPFGMSATGDVFLTDAAGHVARLDTGSAELEPLADSMAAFEAACADPANARNWFLVPVVEELRASGAILAPRQCYGFTILPIFKEGSYAAHNRFALSAIEHIRATADLHHQMTNPITIRQADERDRGGLEACFDELQSFEHSIEPNRAEPALIRDAYIRGLFDDCAKSSGAMFVAETSNRVVGFVCVLSRLESEDIIERDREHAYVTDLVVLEPYRKAGIASELMRVAEAHAFSSGARQLRVGVLAKNGAAHSLYRKLGYRDREIVLEKTLGPTQETT